jgi:apolipoprotein N-acyltransferase
MVRCANNGVSCVIDQNGNVTDRLRDASGRDVDVGGIFSGTVHFYPAQPTLYEAWGDWIVLISSLASVMLGVYWVTNSWGKRAL